MPLLEIQKFLLEGNSLEKLEEQFAITAKRHPKYFNLILFKYNQISSPFEKRIVQECRGLILDEANNWKIVSFPFTKFFNYGEPNAHTIDWEGARCFEKKDGSLLAMFPYDGQWQVSTSGSPDAGGDVNDFGMSFQELFWETFNSYTDYYLPPPTCNKTFLFELCSHFNKIVVQHSFPSLTILGGRDLETLQELSVEEVSSYFPQLDKIKIFPLSSLDECLKAFDHFSGKDQEGFVVCDKFFNRIKLKHPEYLRLHRLKDGLSSKRSLIEVVRNGDVEEIIASLPEYSNILLEAKGKLDALVFQLELEYKAIMYIESQKEFALEAKKCKTSAPLFQLRAKKISSIREWFSIAHIDTIISLLGYKSSE